MPGYVSARVFRGFVAVGLSLAVLGLGLLWLGWQPPTVFGAGATIEVDPSGSDTATCGAPLFPCRSIAYAVASRATSGDTVWVRPGTYTETIAMRAGVVISGSGASLTFVDGEDIRGPMVIAGSGITESASLRGFTVQRGAATNGGGLSISGGAAPIIANVLVSDSVATGFGGGIYIDASSPTLDGVEVSGNAAVRGGGIYITGDASPIIDDLEARSNQASGTGYNDGGGGLYVAGSLTLAGVESISNTAYRGGGLYQDATSAWLSVTEGGFEGNAAQQDGGGLFVRGSLVMSGTHVISNTAIRTGGGVYATYDAVITNVQILSNTAVVWGGGLYQADISSRVAISGARFGDNQVTGTNGYGGGFFASGTATIMDTHVISNYADYGGGVFLSSAGTVSDTEVISNTAGTGGGGLRQDYLAGGDEDRWTHIVDSSLRGNVALAGQGGGILVAGNTAMTRTEVISNSAAAQGGGAYIVYDVVMSDCDIMSNTAVSGGGGLYQYDATGEVTGSGGLLSGNIVTGGSGGGLQMMGASLTLTGTRILGNRVSGTGGGVRLSRNAVLNGTELVANRAGGDGGGMFATFAGGVVTFVGGSVSDNVSGAQGGGLAIGDGLVITGTEIAGNIAATNGGGVFGRRSVLATNVLLAGNSASTGGGIYLYGESGRQILRHATVVSPTVGSVSAIYVVTGTVNITNTIVASYTTGLRQVNGTVSEDYNLYFGNTTHIRSTGGQLNSGTHRLFDQDPSFVDGAADYHIGGDSAALDAGAFLPEVVADIDGDARPTNVVQLNAPDIGCDENVSAVVRRTITDTMTFGAVCARLVFTDTGGLTAVTVGVAYEYPDDMTEVNPVRRVYTITPEGAGPYGARLAFCYTDAEATEAHINETTLKVYRYDGSDWAVYPSTVDMSANVVTATGVTTFSTWALAGAKPTAVDLVSFSAVPIEDGVLVEWETTSEIHSLGFDLYRDDRSGNDPLRLNAVLIPDAAPGDAVGARYRWVDTSVEPGTTYIYLLEDVDERGVTSRHNGVATTTPKFYLPPVLR